ncbi:sortase [Candidatus Saccharibacteria bacterium]|nr:sortase [Candidatus Saccharibacteria bacterium]
MEIKKRLDFRIVMASLYIFAFLVYLLVGFMPAEAANYEISGKLLIPNAKIYSDVTTLSLENNELKTPDTIVGSFSRAENKTLLIGHSSTAFLNLHLAKIGDRVYYNKSIYYIHNKYTLDKAKVDMGDILRRAEKDTLILMTCAGESIGETDATKRLIIEASI